MCDICDLTVTYDSILLKELLHDYLLTLVWSLKKKSSILRLSLNKPKLYSAQTWL